jgi:hypothetical protein
MAVAWQTGCKSLSVRLFRQADPSVAFHSHRVCIANDSRRIAEWTRRFGNSSQRRPQGVCVTKPSGPSLPPSLHQESTPDPNHAERSLPTRIIQSLRRAATGRGPPVRGSGHFGWDRPCGHTAPLPHTGKGRRRVVRKVSRRGPEQESGGDGTSARTRADTSPGAANSMTGESRCVASGR